MRVIKAVPGIVMASALLVGCSSDSDEKHQVTYEATGSQMFDVEYDSPGTHRFENVKKKVIRPDDQDAAGVKGKWTLTVSVANVDDLSLTVGGSGAYDDVAKVACAISVDGELKQKAESETPGDDVWCNADGSGINK